MAIRQWGGKGEGKRGEGSTVKVVVLYSDLGPGPQTCSSSLEFTN